MCVLYMRVSIQGTKVLFIFSFYSSSYSSLLPSTNPSSSKQQQQQQQKIKFKITNSNNYFLYIILTKYISCR